MPLFQLILNGKNVLEREKETDAGRFGRHDKKKKDGLIWGNYVTGRDYNHSYRRWGLMADCLSSELANPPLLLLHGGSRVNVDVTVACVYAGRG